MWVLINERGQNSYRVLRVYLVSYDFDRRIVVVCDLSCHIPSGDMVGCYRVRIDWNFVGGTLGRGGRCGASPDRIGLVRCRRNGILPGGGVVPRVLGGFCIFGLLVVFGSRSGSRCRFSWFVYRVIEIASGGECFR